MRQSAVIKKVLLIAAVLFSISVWHASAYATTDDRDNDGLSNDAEIQIYGTDPDRADTDGNSILDGDQARSGTLPLSDTTDFSKVKDKRIEVDLSEQRLQYFGDGKLLGSFLISSGLLQKPTPVGTFMVQAKKPLVRYRGSGYDFPNTKWNLQFKSKYYIHGTYWHNNFGKPMSHGCVNVAYKDMERLYAFADVGARVIIHR